MDQRLCRQKARPQQWPCVRQALAKTTWCLPKTRAGYVWWIGILRWVLTRVCYAFLLGAVNRDFFLKTSFWRVTSDVKT